MMEVGRLCVKIAGRDANKTCVVLDVIDDNYVLVDGETRRKKCNVKHLEPLDKVVKIKKEAPRSEVKKAFTDLGLGFFEPKTKKPEARVKKTKAKKEVAEKPKKEKKKAEKKAEKTLKEVVDEDKKETPKESASKK